MWCKWLQTHHRHARGWKWGHLTRYMLYSQYTVRLFTPKRHKTQYAHTRVYQRPQSSPRWVPSRPAIPNVTGVHGLDGLWPIQAVPGPHGAPHAAGRRRPRDGPASDASEAAARPLCALRAAASALHSCQPCLRTREQQRRPSASTRSDLGQPQRPVRPLRWPPRQPSAAASRRLAAASAPAGAVSELSRVMRGVGARLVQRPDGHGCVGEA